jgi:hypothetical protein
MKTFFCNPVCLSGDFSYEKSYFQEWIKNNNKSHSDVNSTISDYLPKQCKTEFNGILYPMDI